ncbi:hypothetical protein L0F63_000238, partial [Massospora cicadina]
SLRIAEVEGQLVELNRKTCETLSASWRDARDSLATKVEELSVEAEYLKKAFENAKTTYDSTLEQLQKIIESLKVDRDEALTQLNTCLQAQESQAIKHERLLLASEERINQLHKESQIKMHKKIAEERENSNQLQQQLTDQVKSFTEELSTLKNKSDLCISKALQEKDSSEER